MLTTLFILSLPHIFYYYVWTKSKSFMAFCKQNFKKKDPVEVFSQIAYALKLIQFITLFFYYYSLGPFKFGNMTLIRALFSLALFGSGQYLNAAVYKAIGVDGVYYGTRLGKVVPWYEGFPFGTVPHPQYFGSALSFWGLFLFLYNTADHSSLIILGIATSLYYAFSSYVEETM